MAIGNLLLTIHIINIYHRSEKLPMSPAMKKLIQLLSWITCKPVMHNKFNTKAPKTKVTRVKPVEPNFQESAMNRDFDEVNEEGLNKWENAASVLDRFLFRLAFVGVTSANIVVLCLILPRGK